MTDDDIKRLRELADDLRGPAPTVSDCVHGGAAIVRLCDEVESLRAEVERLRAAHDHQYAMAGLMLREAERNGRERDALQALWQQALNFMEGVPAPRPKDQQWRDELCPRINAALSAKEEKK